MSVTSRQHALQIGPQRIHTPQARCGQSACLIPFSQDAYQRRLAHSVVLGARSTPFIERLKSNVTL